MISLSISVPQADAAEDRAGFENQIWVDGRQGIVKLTWRTGLLEQIRSYVGTTYVSRSGSGEDRGGVFFGYLGEEVMQVMAWRPIARGKETTAHFYLNDKAEQGLKKLLQSVKTDVALEGMQVLGWFRSRTKREAQMDEQDVRFHEKFFAEKYQLAMVLKPSHQRPAEAAVYLRGFDGNFDLAAPVAVLNLQVGPVELGGSGVDGEEPQRKVKFPWMQIICVIPASLILGLGVVLGLQWNHQQEQAASLQESLGFEVEFNGGDMKARWNPAAVPVLQAENAQLLLGGERLQLSHSELAKGYLRIPMKDALAIDTEVRLKVGNREEVSQLIIAAR